MITLLEIIQRSEQYLAAKGIARPRREAEEVIADALAVKRLDLYLQFDRPLSERELPSLRHAIQRRALHEPSAYIAGKVEFAGIAIQVNPSVLIPRAETEILVEKINHFLSHKNLKNKTLWDLCCGSGCIGLSIKNRFPDLQVILSDLSSDALKVAASNDCWNVIFKQGDLFEPFSGLECDFFVCNPPYISLADYLLLDREVKDWEPKLALIGGQTGLEFYARIAKELKNHLRPEGFGWLELGMGQGKEVKKIFESEGWQNCHVETDWSGHDRFFHFNRL